MKFWLTVHILILVQCSYGQDKIFTRNNQKLNVKIVNESGSAFNYTTNETDTVSILTIKKNRISRIEYSNGSVKLMGYQNPRKSMPLGFSIGYGYSKFETYTHHLATYSERGFTLFTTSADYFIIPQIEVQLSIYKSGTEWSFFNPGFNIHFNANRYSKGLTPFAGVARGSALFNDFGNLKGFLQIPLGINYLSKFGLKISASWNKVFYEKYKLPSFIEFRMGWNFKM